MTVIPSRSIAPVRRTPDPIRHVIETHGAVRVLLAAAAALLRPRARPPDATRLPAHLRRDVGLPPLPPPVPQDPRHVLPTRIGPTL